MPQGSTQNAETRRGPRAFACPGLFRIVAARDGGICRLRLPFGHLSAAGARAVANVAASLGNGIVEVTNRANLQIRGLGVGDEEAAIAALVGAGLGPDDPDADDIRNIMVSPLAGIDPAQAIDALPLARALLAHLERDAACRSLSPKFSLLVDGGESVAELDHPHDIWLASMGPGAPLALGFAGTPPLDGAVAAPFVAVAPEKAIKVVGAALRLFVVAAAADPAVTRMRHLYAQLPREAFLDRLEAATGGALLRGVEIASWRRPPARPHGHVGIAAQSGAGRVVVGAVPPLGRMAPDDLRLLADLAGRDGDDSLRLTPWRSVMLPSVVADRATAVVQALEAAGFVCDAARPLATMIACSGSIGCASGRGDTQRDSLVLATALGESDDVVHLTGCAKSCACAGVAETTLVAVAPGAWDLYRKAPGSASRFGELLARGIDIAAAAALIRRTGAGDRP